MKKKTLPFKIPIEATVCVSLEAWVFLNMVFTMNKRRNTRSSLHVTFFFCFHFYRGFDVVVFFLDF